MSVSLVYCLKVTPLSRFVIFEVNIDSHVDPLSVEVIIIEEPVPLTEFVNQLLRNLSEMIVGRC